MPELGKKHECSECGAKFYDMGKPSPVCPRCATPVADEDEQAKPKARRKQKKELVEEKVSATSAAEVDTEPDTGKVEDLDDEDLDDEEFEGLDDEDLQDLDDDEEFDDDEDDDLI